MSNLVEGVDSVYQNALKASDAIRKDLAEIASNLILARIETKKIHEPLRTTDKLMQLTEKVSVGLFLEKGPYLARHTSTKETIDNMKAKELFVLIKKIRHGVDLDMIFRDLEIRRARMCPPLPRKTTRYIPMVQKEGSSQNEQDTDSERPA